MSNQKAQTYIELMRDQIDITRVPFSDRGSRLMIIKDPSKDLLLVRLAERLTSLQPGLDTYRKRPPFIQELCLIDEDGIPLEWQLETYPHLLVFHTRLGEFKLVFHGNQMIAFGLPDKISAGLRFYVEPQFWQATEHGGMLKAVRNAAYVSNADPVQNQITPEEGGYRVQFIVEARTDTTILLAIGDNLSSDIPVPPFNSIYAGAEKRWHDWFNSVPPVDERYRKTYAYAWWVMANNLISPRGSITYEAMTPSKLNYVGLWLWDSALHTLAYRHVDPELAYNQLRAMTVCQLPDGMLPDAVYDEGIISTIEHPFTAEVTKPPIMAWAALKLYEKTGDLGFLEEIYVSLVRWNAWWFSMNDDDLDGVVQYNHPYSSGLDDSPLWDYGMPVESPDLNTYLCVQMGSLAEMAEALGMDAEGAMWRRRAAAMVRNMIDKMWDNETGVFRALHEKQPLPVITPFNLFPLWTGQLPDDIKGRLLEHLTNPGEFWGEFVIPTVARNDQHYDPHTMWRGPIWVNINYFFIEALRQISEEELANELREKTLELVMRHNGIYEYYNAETGSPPETAAYTFGWTAAVFIDLAIQASQSVQTGKAADSEEIDDG
ncbi:MAG: hypothetical protein JXJ17_00155 [Anaerolineae bacterium]|nr:hypothetical protein [Anaerolineae bacterium]